MNLFHLAFTAAALASAALGAAAPERSTKLHFTVHGAVRASALALARHYGAVVSPRAGHDSYTLTLKPGVDAHKALAALRADRRVSLAWSDAEPLTMHQRMQSVAEVEKMFDAVKPSRADALEELAEGKRGTHEKQAEKGADYLGGYLYFVSRRAYPYDRMDWSAYGRAIDHAAKMPTPGAGSSGTAGTKPDAILGTSSNRWQFLGPNNMTFPYQWGFGLGPGSGRINAAAYDSHNAGTYYVGGAEGGVWKTTDGGTTWSPLGDAWPYICVSSIALDPTNSKNIYVGTGDYPGWNSFSVGVMKSNNGGLTWDNTGNAQFGNCCVSAIVVDPDTPSIVTITTGDGPYGVESAGYVWRSVDSGTSWTPAIGTTAEWSDASVSLLDGSSRHYYVTGVNGGTEYLERSDNQGASWTAVTVPSGAVGGSCQIKASAVNAKTVYFFCPSAEKVWKSTDEGSTWSDITGNLGSIGDWGQSTYDYYLTVISSSGSDDLYVGLIDIFELAPSASNWVSVDYAYTGNDLAHVDQHCLTVNPSNPNDILIGNDGGIYHGTRSNGTWSFKSLNKAMGVTQFYDGVWSATNQKLMLGGSQDNGTPLANGDLSNWGVVIGGDGFFSAMNPVNNQIQYGTVYYDSVVETQDGWNSSFGISPPVGAGEPTPFVTIIQQDPVNAQYLYCTSNYLYRWDNNAQSWTSHLGGRSLSNGSVIHCVSVAPSNGNVIYTGSDDGMIFVSRNGGATFTNINSPSLPNRSISSISVDRTNPNSIVVGLSGTGTAHLLQCTNTLGSSPVYVSVSGSGAGTASLPDISVNCMDRDNGSQAATWYVGTDVGVFVTTNAGKSWQNATTPLGLPDVQVTAIQVTKYQTVNVATYGRGMWKLPVAAIGGNSQPPHSVEALVGTFVPGPPAPTDGFIRQLATDDGTTVNMSSGNDATAHAQSTEMEADFNLGTGHTLGGVSFSITCSASAQVTMQVFLYNYSTAKYDVINTYPSTASLSNVLTTLTSSNPAVYMNAAGQVKAVLRALSPNRNGTPFLTKCDSFTISPSLN